ncbi:hypothetical protein [Lichenibacterium dinghuense]|uniref:hypothetical protein n=1 Tax=Lichenibacterium dinghuense TaxID=2895977 RepID=UPI001F1CE0A9|nr:hypothetical protein [Lichenibacterium sp. 6Y81]
MADWSVKGVGVEVTVTSPAGDEYPFVITDVADLHLQLGTRPRWQAGREPTDAAARIDDALAVASRWTEDTFGPA